MAYTGIDDSSAYFQAQLYTGTGSAASITNSGNSDLDPDFVWIKERADGLEHSLFDTVRGVQKRLIASTTAAENTDAQYLTAFNSDGFSVGTDNNVNQSSKTYVAWQWVEHATAGFDIVGYTGNGSARTISHSLGVIPDVIIVKNRGATENWQVYHAKNTDAPETDYLELNTGDATAAVFSIGSGATVNSNTVTYIAYCFANKQGFSKFGSYYGNGHATVGPFVYLGFKPAFVMIKNTETAGRNWYIYDSSRKVFNLNDSVISGNADNAEAADAGINFLSNGFQINTNNAGTSTINHSGQKLIYMAFAKNPFVTSSGASAPAGIL